MVSWTAPTNTGGSAITKYTVTPYVGSTAQTPVTVTGSPPATTTTVSGLTNGTSYTFTVSATNTTGTGPESIASNAVTPSAAPTVDASTTTHQATAATTISAPALTTTQSNELLLAFLSSDGPSGSGAVSFSGVSGGGLTWTLRKRQNAQAGTAEIWQAVAPNPLTATTFTATRSSGSWQGSMTVVAFKNADTALGATAGASAASGAPTASLTTTRAGSWVWAVGTDWSTASARTVGANQTVVDQYLAPAGDTYWVQRQNSPTPASGTVVTINDTAPTTDQYNLALIEILAK
jgi:hypothetical protein